MSNFNLDNFSLEIDLSNDAMQTKEHVAAALKVVAKTLESMPEDMLSGRIRDEDGNTVGQWEFEVD